jgi:hypothetical protein
MTKYIVLLLLDYAVSIGIFYYSAKFLISSFNIFNKLANIELVNKIKNIILIMGSIIVLTGIAGSLYSIFFPDVHLDRTSVYSGYARSIGALLRPPYSALLATGLTLFTGLLLRILKQQIELSINENKMHIKRINEKVRFYVIIFMPILLLWLIAPSIGIIGILIYTVYLYFKKINL